MRVKLTKGEPIILIKPEAYTKILKAKSLTKKSFYFSGMMTWDVEQDIYTLEDIYIIRQKATYNDTDVSEFKDVEFYQSFDPKITQSDLTSNAYHTLYKQKDTTEVISFNFLGVIARKEYKAPSFYGKDEALCKKLFKNAGNATNGIYMVVDTHGNISINAYLSSDGVIIEDIDWDIDYDAKVDVEALDAEIKANILTFNNYNSYSSTTSTTTVEPKKIKPTELTTKNIDMKLLM